MKMYPVSPEKFRGSVELRLNRLSGFIETFEYGTVYKEELVIAKEQLKKIHVLYDLMMIDEPTVWVTDDQHDLIIETVIWESKVKRSQSDRERRI